MEPIVTSMIDTDSYKINMQNYVFKQHPLAEVEYDFVCRNKDVNLGFLKDEIVEQVNNLRDIRLTKQEADYLRAVRFLSKEYLDFLENFEFNPEKHVIIESVDKKLFIKIKGKWIDTILYEVPILAIVNELYFRETSEFNTIRGVGERNLRDKINLIRQYPTFHFADFGTRRRYSKAWQEYVVKELKRHCPQLIGTSNVKLAMELGIKAIGTIAHEIIQCNLAFVDDIRQAQKRAFYTWMETYGTDNGIALSDTFTTKAFFKDFDFVLANNFQGVRQDSGSPIEFGRNMINHYKKMGIDPITKTIVFSDGLTVPKAIEIYKEFVGLIGVSFGIGTSLTNDLSVTPLNIVIKVTRCNGLPVIKLSDDITKAIGDKEMIEKVKKAYDINA